jgi:hypothetical protein
MESLGQFDGSCWWRSGPATQPPPLGGAPGCARSGPAMGQAGLWWLGSAPVLAASPLSGWARSMLGGPGSGVTLAVQRA